MTNMTNYIKFKLGFQEYKYNREKHPELINDYGKEGLTFVEHIDNSLENAKVFELGDDLKKLLLLTKTPSLDEHQEIHLPFDYVFLDIEITREELLQAGVKIPLNEEFTKISGLIFSKGNYQSEQFNNGVIPIGTNLRITTMMFAGQEVIFNTLNRHLWIHEKFKDANIVEKTFVNKKVKKALGDFVINFVHFLNNPEINFLERNRDEESNRKRIKRGKIPLPTSSLIRVIGTLKRCVDNLATQTSEGFSHAFWVRGHFRTLNSERYKNSKGKRMWILPFIKNNDKGLDVVDKIYKVNE